MLFDLVTAFHLLLLLISGIILGNETNGISASEDKTARWSIAGFLEVFFIVVDEFRGTEL